MTHKTKGHGSHHNSGRSASNVTTPLRDPKEALASAQKYNSELGLTPKESDLKIGVMGQSAGEDLRIMPFQYWRDVEGVYATVAPISPTPSPEATLIGDAHYTNQSIFQVGGNTLGWGWSDCDKSGHGPIEFDLKRLAADTVIEARESKQSFSQTDQADLVASVARGYFEEMQSFIATGHRPAPYSTMPDLQGPLLQLMQDAQKVSAPVMLDHFCSAKGIFKSKYAVDPTERAQVISAMRAYESRLPANAPVKRPLQILDVGKNSGDTGSNAFLTKYWILVAGPDDNSDPILLEAKQPIPNPVNNATGNLSQADAAVDVANLEMLQGMKNPMTGYVTISGLSHLVIEHEPQMLSLDTKDLNKKDFAYLAEMSGRNMARSHIQDPELTQQLIRNWLPDSDAVSNGTQAVQSFAFIYADQVEADAQCFQDYIHQ